jgi:hypothetical protein
LARTDLRAGWKIARDLKHSKSARQKIFSLGLTAGRLACTKCRQTYLLNIRDVHKDVPFGYADLAFQHNKPITFCALKNFTTPRAMSRLNTPITSRHIPRTETQPRAATTQLAIVFTSFDERPGE